MSKQLNCSDLGMNCDYVVKGNSDEEILKGAVDHASKTHPEILADATPEKLEQIGQIIKSKTKDTAENVSV